MTSIVYSRDALMDLDSTLEKVRNRISEDPDPLLVEILIKLETIRDNQQERLEKKALEKFRGGFKGFGVN